MSETVSISVICTFPVPLHFSHLIFPWPPHCSQVVMVSPPWLGVQDHTTPWPTEHDPKVAPTTLPYTDRRRFPPVSSSKAARSLAGCAEVSMRARHGEFKGPTLSATSVREMVDAGRCVSLGESPSDRRFWLVTVKGTTAASSPWKPSETVLSCRSATLEAEQRRLIRNLVASSRSSKASARAAVPPAKTRKSQISVETTYQCFPTTTMSQLRTYCRLLTTAVSSTLETRIALHLNSLPRCP